jgi:hypothetical protein
VSRLSGKIAYRSLIWDYLHYCPSLIAGHQVLNTLQYKLICTAGTWKVGQLPAFWKSPHPRFPAINLKHKQIEETKNDDQPCVCVLWRVALRCTSAYLTSSNISIRGIAIRNNGSLDLQPSPFRNLTTLEITGRFYQEQHANLRITVQSLANVCQRIREWYALGKTFALTPEMICENSSINFLLLLEYSCDALRDQHVKCNSHI